MEFKGLLDGIAAQVSGLVEIYVSGTALVDWQRMVVHADEAGYLKEGDPREITTVADLEIIRSYMECLSSITGKRVFLAPESVSRETVSPYFSVG